MVERSHGFFRSSLSVCKSRVESVKAESSDKNIVHFSISQSGLKEPGLENRRTFSKKAREPQKFALVNISESRTVKQAFKTV